MPPFSTLNVDRSHPSPPTPLNRLQRCPSDIMAHQQLTAIAEEFIPVDSREDFMSRIIAAVTAMIDERLRIELDVRSPSHTPEIHLAHRHLKHPHRG